MFKVVWHRKYDKMGVHVLTIGSETFISDLRIRPIKQQISPPPISNNINFASGGVILAGAQHNVSSINSQITESSINTDDYKLTWNLEIRRLRKDDTAFYYCVLNSENAYGQIYKLNVLCNYLAFIAEFFVVVFILLYDYIQIKIKIN